ncbi:MAG: 3-phosphoshikimate 1-carboxyvinyltransferase [Desulfobacterales bacterium]|nr:3-phosphoshikimate 1-carboxyvinyltransferase [Desulfobacterales bacterium]
MIELKHKSDIHAVVRIPGSKSITHRALIAAALAEGKTTLKNPLVCEDTLYTVLALQTLGVEITLQDGNAFVCGNGGGFHHTNETREIYLGNSGTSYRLLLSVAALGRGDCLFTGSPRMRERPVGDLVKALRDLGATLSCSEEEGFPPVLVKGQGIGGGQVKMPGEVSSQFTSSLLLSGPYAQEDVIIEIVGKPVSQPYVDMTLDVMQRFGVRATREDSRCFTVPAGQRYHPCQLEIDGDVSTASYFWAAAAVTGGTVATLNINPHTGRQGDMGILDIMEAMGCRVAKEDDRVVVQGGSLSGVDVDMSAMPDMVPTLATLALSPKEKQPFETWPICATKRVTGYTPLPGSGGGWGAGWKN